MDVSWVGECTLVCMMSWRSLTRGRDDRGVTNPPPEMISRSDPRCESSLASFSFHRRATGYKLQGDLDRVEPEALATPPIQCSIVLRYDPAGRSPVTRSISVDPNMTTRWGAMLNCELRLVVGFRLLTRRGRADRRSTCYMLYAINTPRPSSPIPSITH